MQIRDSYTGSGTVIGVEPVYLVEIWRHSATWTVDNPVWEYSEYEFEDCDITQVLQWVKENMPSDDDSRYVVYAYYLPEEENPSEIHMRLIGQDPTRELGNSVPMDWVDDT